LLLLRRLLTLLMCILRVVRLVGLPRSRRSRRLSTTQTSVRLIRMLLRRWAFEARCALSDWHLLLLWWPRRGTSTIDIVAAVSRAFVGTRAQLLRVSRVKGGALGPGPMGLGL
ncbi:hypothetical protein KCV03_g344, partial [Aureobasidium melanogenum]